MSEQATVIVWFRQELRVSDNPALDEAVAAGAKIVPVYIYDPAGEGDWPPGGASKWWLHHSLAALDARLKSLGSRLLIVRGDSLEMLLELSERFGADEVYWNRRYEPAIVARDTKLKKAIADKGLRPKSFNGSLLFSPLNIENKSGKPFRVFTPFWKHISSLSPRKPCDAPKKLDSPKLEGVGEKLDTLELLPKRDWADGFGELWQPGEEGAQEAFRSFKEGKVARYSKQRDFPSEAAISRLSPHLHFGELSPSQIWWSLDLKKHEPFLRQLGWREFANHLLYHFSDTPTEALNEAFQNFPWKKNPKWLKAWQRGRTGFPIVDAGMRELWLTGFMHNRVRMVAASFLVKHLLQPWQEGAAWFWDTLLDADLANNTMGWQWVAGCGADAAPYFRVFNPIAQGERFDESGEYTRRWLPELAKLPDKYLFQPWEASAEVLERAGVDLGNNYPRPIVEHSEGRERALEAYSQMKDK